MSAALDKDLGARLTRALDIAGRFFMGDADVQRAMHALARRLDEAGIPYAIAGGLALAAHGFVRVTEDVDVLLDRSGLAELKARYLGRGYVELFKGSKGIRDTEFKVKIDILITGDFPGDGKPKPVAFPAPTIGIRAEGFSVLPLERLIELKLASGISAPHRLKDLADVLELVRARGLPRDLGERLDPSVRAKWDELWSAAQAPPDE